MYGMSDSIQSRFNYKPDIMQTRINDMPDNPKSHMYDMSDNTRFYHISMTCLAISDYISAHLGTTYTGK